MGVKGPHAPLPKPVNMKPSTDRARQVTDAIAEVLADLSWYHSAAIVRLLGPPREWLEHSVVLMAACCWDRLQLQVREAAGVPEAWE